MQHRNMGPKQAQALNLPPPKPFPQNLVNGRFRKNHTCIVIVLNIQSQGKYGD